MNNKIEEAISYLDSKNIIKRKNLGFVITEKDLINKLLLEKINGDIIKNIIGRFFDKKIITDEEINILSNIQKTKYGFLSNENYYIPLNLYYNNNIFKKIMQKLKQKVFKDIVIISSYDLSKINSIYEKSIINAKNENNNIIIYSLKQFIQQMIDNKISKLLIDTRKEEILFNYETYSVKHNSNIFYNVNTDQIIKLIKNEITNEYGFIKSRKNYKLEISEISSSTVELSLYDYFNEISGIKDLDNFNDIKPLILNSSGLFLFSEKNNYGYYYQVLDIITENFSKKVLSIDESKRINKATKNINIKDSDVHLDSSIINDFDVLMIENINSIDIKVFKMINLFIANGKKVIIFVNSNDAINSLSNIIYNYQELEKDIVAEYLNGIFHVTRIPKLCEHCKIPKVLINIENVREHYKDIINKYDKKTIIFIRNEDGCRHCKKGYSGHVDVEQYIRKTQVLNQGVTKFNIRNLKEGLTAENNYRKIEDRVEDLIMKEKIVSIYDIKSKI